MHVHDPIADTADDELFRVAAPFVRVIDDVVSAAECDALVARIEALGPSFAPVTTSQGFVDKPELRNNDRVIFDDVDLANDLWRRLREVGPPATRFRQGHVFAGSWSPLAG